MTGRHAEDAEPRDTLRLKLWDVFWLWRGGERLRAAWSLCFSPEAERQAPRRDWGTGRLPSAAARTAAMDAITGAGTIIVRPPSDAETRFCREFVDPVDGPGYGYSGKPYGKPTGETRPGDLRYNIMVRLGNMGCHHDVDDLDTAALRDHFPCDRDRPEPPAGFLLAGDQAEEFRQAVSKLRERVAVLRRPADREPPAEFLAAPAPSLVTRRDGGEVAGEEAERIRERFSGALRRPAMWLPDEPPTEFLAAPAGGLSVADMEAIQLLAAPVAGDPSESPAEFVASPAAEPWWLGFLAAPSEPVERSISYEEFTAAKAAIGARLGLAATITVEPTLPPLPSFTPWSPPHACPDVPQPPPWTPPDEGMREHVAAVLARPARSALGSWVDDVLAAPPGLGHLQPEWEDGGWTSA